MKDLYVSWDEYHRMIEQLCAAGLRLRLQVRFDPLPGARWTCVSAT